jgi:ATP-binding cassette, subfamily B, bacterial
MENVLEPEAAQAERFTLQEYFTPIRQRRLRRFPHLLRTAVGIVWAAARRQLLALAALQLLVGAGLAVQLLAIRGLLGDLFVSGGPQSFAEVLPELLVVAVLGAVVATATVVIDAQQRVLGQLVALHASDEVIQTAASVDLVTFDSPDFHDRLQRAQLSASQRPAQMVNGLLAVVGSGFAIGGIVVALLVIQPLFCALVLVAYLPAWLATNRAARLVYRFTVEQTERERRRMYLFELLTSKREAQEVRAFDLGDHLGDRHRRIYRALIDDLREVLRRRLRVALVGQLVTAALTAGALTVLVWFVIRDWMSLSEAGSAAGAMILLTGRLRALSSGAGSLYESSLYLEDYSTFVAARPRIESARPTRPAPPDPQVLAAEAVTFTYPSRTRPSLVDASLTLRRGEVVALVGENGSGKTTFAKLLACLYEPDSGSIAWDGTDVAELDPRTVRARVAVIFQDFVRYLLSAHDNIALGEYARAGDAGAVERAARAAGIHDALAALPRAYETLLGPEHFGGSDLSGGQWQRVALARAFFRDAPVVILDEPTASLDPRAEAALYDSMRELYAGRGVLLISHRFGSVRTADRIYVLRDGRVIEQGNHGELMAAGGHYAELFRLQARSYVD